MGKSLVVGYGNPLLGDDGVGRAVVQALAEAAAIDQFEVGRLPSTHARTGRASCRGGSGRFHRCRGRGRARQCCRHPGAERAAAIVGSCSPLGARGAGPHVEGTLRPIAGCISGHGGRRFVRVERRTVGSRSGRSAEGRRGRAEIDAAAARGRHVVIPSALKVDSQGGHLGRLV